MIPSTALQDAVALLTVAMDVDATDELEALVAEFQAKADPDELMVALGRSAGPGVWLARSSSTSLTMPFRRRGERSHEG